MTTRTKLYEYELNDNEQHSCPECHGAVNYSVITHDWRHASEQWASMHGCSYHTKGMPFSDTIITTRPNVDESETLQEALIQKMQLNGIKLSEARAVASLMINQGMSARRAFKRVGLYR